MRGTNIVADFYPRSASPNSLPDIQSDFEITLMADTGKMNLVVNDDSGFADFQKMEFATVEGPVSRTTEMLWRVLNDPEIAERARQALSEQHS